MSDVETVRAHPSRDVFIVCNNIEELGGLQRWAHHTAAMLTEAGHTVTLIGVVHPEQIHDYGRDLPYRTMYLHEEHPPSAWSPRTVRDRLNVGAQRREALRKASVQQAADRLTGLFRRARPGGIVIVPQVWAMEWVGLSDTAGLRVIGMSHESFEASAASSRHRRVKKYFAGVDRLLLLTAEDADAWSRDGLNNTDFMPNPLPIEPREFTPRSSRVVVSLGRFSFEKGYDLLLEAWALVAPRHPDWTLRLYGAGPEDARLRAQTWTLGVHDSVEFPGRTSDIEGALADTSVFALSSRAEGFPISLLEAMAMGVPSVGFDCAPGVREIITDDGNGLLIPRGNTEEFARGLDRLMSDQSLRDRLGKQGLADVLRFSPEAILERWEQLFVYVYR
ncbi:glycosyltransferase [Embleya sp. NPDC055664]|uniref:glycosyltransferase n=1 Tax=Embleya sp. NPDC059237 TaxID=3346784 RepID=UPI0036C094AE